MATLTGNTIASTYAGLLSVNGAISTGSVEVVEDGAGTNTALWLSTVGASLGVDDTGADFRVYSATTNEGLFYDASEDEFGLLLTTKLKFHDIGGGEEIFASANGHLEINAGTTLDITAPTVDLNSATEFNIDTVLYDLNASGATTLNGVPVTITSTGDITLDSSTDIILDAAGGNFEFKDAGTAMLTIDVDGTAGDIDVNLMVDGDDLVFNQYDGTEVMRIADTAKVGIGTNNPTFTLDVEVDADATHVASFINAHNGGYGIFISQNADTDSSGDTFILCKGGATTKMTVRGDGDVWTADDSVLSSDRDMKENIVDATPKLEDLLKLKVRNFNFKSLYKPSDSKKIGFIAQEVEEVFPSLVREHLSPNQEEADAGIMRKEIKQSFVPILIKAVQELSASNDALKARIEVLEAA